MTSNSSEIIRLLGALSGGNRRNIDRITPLVYAELRRLATSYFRSEQPSNTLQPTALVHEAYLRLIGQENVEWKNRAHFMGIAAQIMRRILVDRARARHALKRGGQQQRVTIEQPAALARKGEIDLMALDEALNRLSQIDTQQARIVELHFFGGLNIEESAHLLPVQHDSKRNGNSTSKTATIRPAV